MQVEMPSHVKYTATPASFGLLSIRDTLLETIRPSTFFSLSLAKSWSEVCTFLIAADREVLNWLLPGFLVRGQFSGQWRGYACVMRPPPASVYARQSPGGSAA